MSDKWRRYWQRAWWAAFKGGCHAVAPTGGVSLMDPNDWGLSQRPWRFLGLAGFNFLVSSAIAFASYVRESKSPVDDDGTKPPFNPETPCETKPEPS